MLVQIANPSTSSSTKDSDLTPKSKVKAMLEKFENKTSAASGQTKNQKVTLSNAVDKKKDDKNIDGGRVLERKKHFQKGEESRKESKTNGVCESDELREVRSTPVPNPRSKHASSKVTSHYANDVDEPLSVGESDLLIKPCKLRRNVPVTSRKPGPEYAVVSPKIRRRREKQLSKAAALMADSVDSTPGIEVIAESSLPVGRPPAKPPRTFEHDTYVAHKALKFRGASDPLTERIYDEVTEVCRSPTERKFPPIAPFAEKSSVGDKKGLQLAPTRSVLPRQLSQRKQKAEDGSEAAKKRLEPYAVTDLYKDGGLKVGVKVGGPTNTKPWNNPPPQVPVPEPPKAKKQRPRSRFFVPASSSSEDEEEEDGEKPRQTLRRYFSEAHVYEEPCVGSLKSYNSEETLVVSNIIYDKIHCQQEEVADGVFSGDEEQDLDDNLNSNPSVKNRVRWYNNGERKSPSKNPRFVKSWPKALRKPQHNGGSRGDYYNLPGKRLNSASVRDMVSRSFSIVRQPRRRHPDKENSAGDDDSGDSDNELTPKELEERIIYMRTVSRGASVKYDCRRRLTSDSSLPRLFDCALVVRLQSNETTAGYDPYVKLSYPLEFANADSSTCPALQFCFPDAEFWKPSQSGENYTFVLTNEKGDRTYGYCRRIKPDDCQMSLPVVYCILSPVLSFNFYSKILTELERRHGSPDGEMTTFLDTLHHRRLPGPGGSLNINLSRSSSKEEFRRPEDITVDNNGVDRLVQSLDISNLMKVFASLLLERRVVLYSSSLNVLSDCAHGLQALLFPFTWQHTFVPILPPALIDIIASPTPFLVGVLTRFTDKLRELPLDQALMVDLDHNRLFRETGDELKVIPKKMQKALSTALKMAKSAPDADGCRSLMAVEAFLRLFVETVGHYDNYVVTQQDGNKVFQKEEFCNAAPSHGTTTFLQWFTETQMFNIFIDGHVDGTATVTGVFVKRIQEYKQELENTSQSLRENFKDFGKKVKTLGERLIGLKTPEKTKT